MKNVIKNYSASISILFQILLSVSLAYSSYLMCLIGAYAFLIGIICLIIISIIFSILQQYFTRSINAKEKNDKSNALKAQELCELRSKIRDSSRELLLYKLSKLHDRLNLNDSDVITIYISDGIMLHQHTRFTHISVPKRPSSHKITFGVLGKICATGWWFDNNFPDPADFEAYWQYAKQHYNMTKNATKELTRKYRTYFGSSIIVNETQIGVLLVESTLQDRNDTEDKKCVQKTSRSIASFFEHFKSIHETIAPLSIEEKIND